MSAKDAEASPFLDTSTVCQPARPRSQKATQCSKVPSKRALRRLQTLWCDARFL
jgi:hypothetical protein